MFNKQWFCFKPSRDFAAAITSLLLMWVCYYACQNVVGEDELASLIVSLFTVVGLCVVFPVWWSIRNDKTGIKGLRIHTKNLPLCILFSIILAVWRGLEAREYIFQPEAVLTLLFNLLSIWEVLFIYGWLFTRYEKCFGKIPAILMTSVSVGIYHTGSLEPDNILHLCIVIVVCGIFYALLENLFLLWPIYWTIGTSASTLGSDMDFPAELVIMSAIVLVIQILFIAIMEYRFQHKNYNSKQIAQ